MARHSSVEWVNGQEGNTRWGGIIRKNLSQEAIVEKQSAEVDAFTGATSSSNNFKKLAAKAIENATAGNTEKAIVE